MKTLEEVKADCNLADVYTAAEFADLLRDGKFTPYDGFGYFHNGDIETSQLITFNPLVILALKNQYPYICWYSK